MTTRIEEAAFKRVTLSALSKTDLFGRRDSAHIYQLWGFDAAKDVYCVHDFETAERNVYSGEMEVFPVIYAEFVAGEWKAEWMRPAEVALKTLQQREFFRVNGGEVVWIKGPDLDSGGITAWNYTDGLPDCKFIPSHDVIRLCRRKNPDPDGTEVFTET